jgi:membrane-associated phospholipid phosphatase
MKIKEVFSRINIAEFYTISILMLYSIMAIIFFHTSNNIKLHLLENLIIISFILTISQIKSENKSYIFFRKFYLLSFVYLIYNQTHSYIPLINPNLYDNLLIKLDYAIFGCNPTDCTMKIVNPYLTEYFQFCYMTFFFMPVIHGVELHLHRRDFEFDILLRNILFGFYLSYLLYFIMPAVGPRFTLYDFSLLQQELPGILLTDFFRNVVNAGGGIINSTIAPALQVNRDCMPSGHTMMTLINITLAFKFKSRLRYVFLIFGSSLIFATIYLRYHYVVDLIAGALCFVISMHSEKVISKHVKLPSSP